MKRLINSSLFVIAILVFALSANAQPEPPRPPMVPDSTQVVRMVEQMSAYLHLDQQQEEQVAKFHNEHFKELKLLLEQEKGEHELIKKQVDLLKDNFESQLASVLSPEQFERFKGETKEHDKRDCRPMKRSKCNEIDGSHF